MMNLEKVSVERMVAGGDGMARLADGRVVFIDGAITGERVSIEITANKKDFARARIVEILEASAHRVAPPCRFVEAGCGG
ncbi:MAG: TRAM domain-containing protein, partial [Actinomycetota bacterium]